MKKTTTTRKRVVVTPPPSRVSRVPITSAQAAQLETLVRAHDIAAQALQGAVGLLTAGHITESFHTFRVETRADGADLVVTLPG